jgi:hypothetical protein
MIFFFGKPFIYRKCDIQIHVYKINFFDTTNCFREHFRFTKESMLRLVELLKPNLQHQSRRGLPLTPLQQTCVAMSYFASATFQRTAGLLGGVKKTCAHTTIHRVTRAICLLARDYIQPPSVQQMQESADFFIEKYGLPYFSCGVDGTQVPLASKPIEADLPPGLNGQDFWCRHQCYSFNCQIVANHRHQIYSITARWAGSTHDSRIWRASSFKEWFEDISNTNRFLIAGDSAYPLSEKLMKPFFRPPPQSREASFNHKLSGLRTICTEDTIGKIFSFIHLYSF